ncbi:unnamed protein product, partial [Symbiodinium sp. KB8]
MSGAISGDDSEPVPEVPTEVPSDLEEVVASGEGVPAPSGPTVTPPSPAMTSVPVEAAASPSTGAELEALAKKQRLMLDKAYRYLLDQGFGIPELASLDLDEVPAMARQLAEELAIPMGDWLEDALYCWLQEAQQEAKLHRRLRGYLQDDLTWMTLMPPMVLPTALGAGREPRYAPEHLRRGASGTGYGPADLVDYLLARRDEPCGRTVPDAIVKAISWVEKVAEFPEEQRATHGRLAWAAKDKITEVLSEGARLIKRAPRYPVYLLARLEHLVVDPGQAIGWRVWAWAKLVMVWGSLVGRLVTTLRRTKTSGRNRRVRELPVAISEYAFFARRSWLQADGALEPKPASYADAMVATAGLLATLGLPLKDLLGRWKPEGSDIYARSFGGRVARLQALFAEVARGADRYQKLDESEIAADLVPWLMERPGLSRVQAELTVEGLRRSWREGGLGTPDPIPATLASEEPPLGEPTGDADPEDSSQASASEPEEPVCKQARVLDREANYVIVELPGAIYRSVCSARARVPDMYNNATMGLGVAFGVARRELGKCRQNLLPQLEATSRPLCRELRVEKEVVLRGSTFCPDELPEAFANHFTRGQIAEMAARLEDARLAMEADDQPATQTLDPGSQRLWLAGGRSASPQRELEYRLRATSWSEFSQEEVDAMSELMKQSLTRLARHEQDAAKAKARAEAEAIAKELARKKKAEHDAKEEQLELEKFEKELEAAKKLSLGEEVDATDPTAASSAMPAGGAASTAAGPSGDDATGPSQSKFPPLPLRPEAKSQVRGRGSDATDSATSRRRSKSSANKSGIGPEPTLSWSEIFADANTWMRPLRAAIQDVPMGTASTATDCKGTKLAVELFGRARPPLQSRCNARPQGKGSYTLDLSSIDRDLWPLGSWNKALGERGPQPRYKGGGKGKHRELDPRAIWQISECSEIAQLTEIDRQRVCAQGPAPGLPRYRDPPQGVLHRLRGEQGPYTAIGAWDEDNAIFRCCVICPLCRMRPCNRRMWWRL